MSSCCWDIFFITGEFIPAVLAADSKARATRHGAIRAAGLELFCTMTETEGKVQSSGISGRYASRVSWAGKTPAALSSGVDRPRKVEGITRPSGARELSWM